MHELSTVIQKKSRGAHIPTIRNSCFPSLSLVHYFWKGESLEIAWELVRNASSPAPPQINLWEILVHTQVWERMLYSLQRGMPVGGASEHSWRVEALWGLPSKCHLDYIPPLAHVSPEKISPAESYVRIGPQVHLDFTLFWFSFSYL